MAVNQATQKLAIAQGLIAQATVLSNVWVGIQKYNQLFVKSGLTFSAGDFDNTSLQYVDPTTMATLITQLNAFVTWMSSSNNGDIMFRDTIGLPTSL